MAKRISSTRRSERGTFARMIADRHLYIFLLPWLVLFILYTVYPIGASWYFSLLDWNGFDADGTYIGLANFKELVGDEFFWNALKNTFLFLAWAVPLRVFIALIFAVLLNSRKIPFSNFFRTVIFTPVVTTGAIVGIVMSLVLDPAGGPVNLLLSQVRLIREPVNFLGEARLAFPTAVIVWSWKWLGITLVYWLASLQTIPSELYEAAQIDGAGGFGSFFHITVPLLIPFGAIIILITAVDATRIFELMLTLTGGGPYFATEVIEIFIYRMAFLANIPRLGYASAAAALFGLIFMVFTLAQTVLLQLARKARAA
jgi:multiple sugar transport system permease protein